MSTDLELVQSIETRPADLEHRLSVAMRGVGERIVQKPEIVRALTACDLIPAGIVITDEAQAAAIADALLEVIDGQKSLTTAAGLAARIPRQMEAALKESVIGTVNALAAAKQRGNDARLAWQVEVRRRAAQEERERMAAAAKAAEQAKAADPDTPVAEVAPVVVPRVVTGGLAKSGTQVRIDPKEIVDISQVPAEWLQINAAVARAVFLSDEMTKQVKRAAPGESVVWKGVRFESVEYAVNRR